jgi:hypothetical protein
MRLNILATMACITVVALSVTACKSSSQASAPVTNPVATGAQADETSPGSQSSSPSTATNAAGSASAPSSPLSGGAKCTDLTNAEASAALGKATSLVLDTSGTPLAGLTICNVTIANEAYPVQLAVNTVAGAQQFAADKVAFAPTANVSGVGDQAFSSDTGVEALTKGVDIRITGPAGPVLDNNFTVPTALAKAMAAALS